MWRVCTASWLRQDDRHASANAIPCGLLPSCQASALLRSGPPRGKRDQPGSSTRPPYSHQPQIPPLIPPTESALKPPPLPLPISSGPLREKRGTAINCFPYQDLTLVDGPKLLDERHRIHGWFSVPDWQRVEGRDTAELLWRGSMRKGQCQVCDVPQAWTGSTCWRLWLAEPTYWIRPQAIRAPPPPAGFG